MTRFAPPAHWLASLAILTLLMAVGCGGEFEEWGHNAQLGQPATKSDTYKLATATISGPESAQPNKAFKIKVKGTIAGGTSTCVYAYKVYENATWTYHATKHVVQVSSGKLLAASNFNWGANHSATYSLSRAKGSYRYTYVFGYRCKAHTIYDVAVDTTVTVQAAVPASTYQVDGKDSARISRLNWKGATWVNLRPLVTGNFWGNIKVSFDNADKVKAVSIEENPDGPGMWNWWTTATADPTKGSTGKQYMYKDGGGSWAQQWVAKGKGTGKPGSIDTGAGGTGHFYMYTSGNTKSAGFKPLRLGFRLRPGVTGPVKVTFKVYSNSLTSYNWHPDKLGAPVVSQVTLMPRPTLAWIDMQPDVLSKTKQHKWVKSYIELLNPKYDVRDIAVNSIRFNGTVPVAAKRTKIGDYDNDGRPDLMVRFSAAKVVNTLKVGLVRVTITGTVAGVPFVGRTLMVVIP